MRRNRKDKEAQERSRARVKEFVCHWEVDGRDRREKEVNRKQRRNGDESVETKCFTLDMFCLTLCTLAPVNLCVSLLSSLL